MLDWARSAPPEHFWLLTGLALAAASLLLWLAFQALQRARLVEDTPTARVRSAAQGYVELQGHARLMPGPAIICPLSYTRCVWYRYSIERRETTHSGGRQRTRWRTIESGRSDGLFLLADTTGECIVDPEGAEITPSLHRVWYGSSRRPDRVPQSGRAWIGFGGYRYTERLIQLGDSLYAIGHFRTQGKLDPSYDGNADVRELLAEWKRDQRALLREFDADGDGRIDLDEWETARRRALEQVQRHHLEQSLEPDLHVLSRPRDGRPYLISTHDQHRLVRRLRISALTRLLAGLAMAAGALLALQARGLLA